MKYEILLADDDDSVRLVLSKALTRAGHTVRATDNADTLLKWAEAGQGDIVVTDVMMGGREVFERLPELSVARPKLPVIIISANNTVNTALKSGQHKVFEYVPKPFDLDDVTSAVARAGLSVNPRKQKQNLETRRLPMIGRSAVMQPVFVTQINDSDQRLFNRHPHQIHQWHWCRACAAFTTVNGDKVWRRVFSALFDQGKKFGPWA